MDFKPNNISKPILNTNIVLARFPRRNETDYTLYTILGKIKKDNNRLVSAIINLTKTQIKPEFGKMYNISVLNIYPYESDMNYVGCVINSYLDYYKINVPNKLILILCNDGITTSGYYLIKYLQIHNHQDNFMYMMDKILPYFKK